ncbi:helix-turn-helix transcriptional regulator [Thalassospira sp.]|uniref:helix-turn-helix domain-containing protein n=1 Tax=Thalassospira sp. TaxID=1912094 RepID=UPI002735C366|nr:helix-turn-helix transcriptional regulator [Thalassospira sp.]MDP2697064.1 helix-turn-helix transcriptional regulator [Thalassospira sp.]
MNNADMNNMDVRDIIAAKDANSGGHALPTAYARRIFMEIDPPLTVWRDYRGMTQRDLARKAGIAPGYLSKIENGKKAGSLDAWRKLAAALDAPIDALVA